MPFVNACITFSNHTGEFLIPILVITSSILNLISFFVTGCLMITAQAVKCQESSLRTMLRKPLLKSILNNNLDLYIPSIIWWMRVNDICMSAKLSFKERRKTISLKVLKSESFERSSFAKNLSSFAESGCTWAALRITRFFGSSMVPSSLGMQKIGRYWSFLWLMWETSYPKGPANFLISQWSINSLRTETAWPSSKIRTWFPRSGGGCFNSLRPGPG